MIPASDSRRRTLKDDLRWSLHLVVFSVAVGGLVALVEDQSSFFHAFLTSCSYGFSFYLACRLIGRMFPGVPRWGMYAVALPVSLSLGTYMGAFVLRSKGSTGNLEDLLRFALMGLIFTAVAVYVFYSRHRMYIAESRLQAEQVQRAKQEKLLAESRLRALQSQIEPHFIFNALANVQGLIDADPPAARRLLEKITNLLRRILARDREASATLGQELQIVEDYLGIQQQRLGRRLYYRVDVPASLDGIRFPPLLLQPLVENAVRHGIEPDVQGGELNVTGRVQDGKVMLEVRDMGRGFADNGTHGIGLLNVRERLAAFYGGRAKLVLRENSPQGVVATLEFPLDRTG